MFKPIQSLAELSPGKQFTWYILAAQAGFINAGGFLACHRFVTHTTGFATFFGVEFAQKNYHTAFNMLAVPIFFLLGTITSAFFIDRNKILQRRPQYEFVLALMSGILLLVSWLGVRGSLGVFGEPLVHSRDFALLALLCLCSGLQNALTTTATSAVVRTTHLTGMTTDLGLGISRVIWGRSQELKQVLIESAANKIRMALIASFLLGSVLGAAIFMQHQFFGFFLPFAISLILTIIAFMNLKKESRQS
jgi:uncharacterized membrane protein YoaK (UPF0700 family)